MHIIQKHEQTQIQSIVETQNITQIMIQANIMLNTTEYNNNIENRHALFNIEMIETEYNKFLITITNLEIFKKTFPNIY